jgi:elongation factor G
MLETLADHDDTLMEQLLEDVTPDASTVFNDLTSELRDCLITPVLIGSAENATGILRLLKTIRHDAPNVETTRQRLGIDDGNSAVAGIVKTIHTTHAGKLSVARVLAGKVSDGETLKVASGDASKVSGMATLLSRETAKVPPPQQVKQWRSANWTTPQPAMRWYRRKRKARAWTRCPARLRYMPLAYGQRNAATRSNCRLH